MMETLKILLRVAGLGLIVLALAHIPMARTLNWRIESGRMSEANAAIFKVHTLFICVGLALIGLPALLAPEVFLIPSRLGAWVTCSISAFWALRLYVQWLVYPTTLWRGKRFETAMHIFFTFIWLGLTVLFAQCARVQLFVAT